MKTTTKLLGMAAATVLVAHAGSGVSSGAGPYTVSLTCPDGTVIACTGYYSAYVGSTYIVCDGARINCPSYWCSVRCADGTSAVTDVHSAEECGSYGENLCAGHGGVRSLVFEPQ
jgi:hypothetical protein